MREGDGVDEILETAVTRREILRALATEPHHRRELQAAFDVSKTTCHRIVRSFDEKGFVRRTDAGYELSPLGRIVAAEVTRFEEAVETGCRLEPLLDLLAASDVAFDHTLVTDADVSWEVERDGASLDSGVERVRNADRVRVLDWTPVPDLYIERIFGIMAENGTDSEAVYPGDEIRNRLDRFPDLHDDLLDSDGSHRYWVHEDVPPWGMTIYDDALVELRAYDRETGAYVLEATTGDPDAVAWATDVFAEYREAADPLTAVEDLPDWGDYSW